MSGDLVWRALHVHRYADQDGLLTDGVAPVLGPLRESGAVDGWFFLRYWQGGHHVRLRLRVAVAEAEAVVEEVAGKLRAHLAENPAAEEFDAAEFSREAQPTMASLEGAAAEEIHPPDTIRRVAYVPELDKYGGPEGVRIAEDYFGASSDIVLDALRRTGGRPSKRIGMGYAMMLRGLCATDLTPAEVAAFFAHYCVLWSPYAFDGFLDAWPGLLREHRVRLHAHTAAVLANPAALDGDPLHTAVGEAWRRVRTAGAAVLDRVLLAGPGAPPARRAQVLLVSYLHTHNNRFGLIPELEAFLGYLGHHVLSECAGVPADTGLDERVRVHRAQRTGTP